MRGKNTPKRLSGKDMVITYEQFNGSFYSGKCFKNGGGPSAAPLSGCAHLSGNRGRMVSSGGRLRLSPRTRDDAPQAREQRFLPERGLHRDLSQLDLLKLLRRSSVLPDR